MENKKILLIGAGGHCHSILDSLLCISEFQKIGLIDQFPNGRSVTGVPVIGDDHDLPRLRHEGWNYAFVALGSIGNPDRRRMQFQRLRELGFILPYLVDPTAVVARDVLLGEGVFVGKRAVINSGAKVGCCAIINTGAIVEHDCMIGDFSHISPGSILCGQVWVGEDSHIGAGTVVRQQVRIGNRVLIGMGSTVVKNLPDHVKAFGNPCRVVKEE